MTVTQIYGKVVFIKGTIGLVYKKMALIHVQLHFWPEHLSILYIMYVYM